MRLLSVFLLALFGCGGSLSDEQRRQLREAQEQQAIRKIPEADLLAEAFARGRTLAKLFQDRKPEALPLDSISNANQVVIRWHELDAFDALNIERQLIEAYVVAASTGSAIADNVQRLGADTLLYTMPVTRYRPDSVLEVKGMWSIRMATRNVVLGMKHN
jgi:hypothetical protein